MYARCDEEGARQVAEIEARLAARTLFCERLKDPAGSEFLFWKGDLSKLLFIWIY